MHSIDPETISQAFASYKLGSIKGEMQQIKGDVDLNYQINTETGSYLLKYIVDPSTLKQFEFLGTLHEYLRKKEVPVPKIFKTQGGSYVSNSFILYEFIDGKIEREWSDKEIISMTQAFAKMLRAMGEHHIPNFIKNKDDKYVRGGNIQYCYRIFRPLILKLDCPDDIKMPIVHLIDTLYEKYTAFESLPKSLINGDLNEMNALFKDGNCAAIIDLSLSYDPIVYSLGVTCYWFAFPWWEPKFNMERLAIMIETFEKTIPLSPLEKELLPYMIMRRSMMDIMITLQFYWSQTARVPVPESRLKEQIERNNTIMNLIKKDHE